jgi:hypothetical protein
MSQTYRIGSLSFTGSQAVLSASLDVSGSGNFTNGLTVTGSLNVVTGSNITLAISGGVAPTLRMTTSSFELSGIIGTVLNYGNSNILNLFQTVWVRNKLSIGGFNTTITQDNRLNVKGYGTGSSTINTVLVNSSNTELFKVLDDGTTTVNGSLTVANGDVSVVTGSTNYLRIFPSTGNTFIGSTPVDGGFKLDVNGTTRLQGALTVSAGGATVTGNTVLSGSLNVSGSVTSTGILTTYNASIASLPVILRGGNNDSSIFIGGSTMAGSAGTRNVVIDPTGTYSTFGVGGVGQNVIIGRAASAITTGGNNVIIGNHGGQVTTGAYNVFIGTHNGESFTFNTASRQILFISTGVTGTEGTTKAIPSDPQGWSFIGGTTGAVATNKFYFGAAPFFNHPYPASLSNLDFFAPSATGSDFLGGSFTINAGRGTGTGSAGDVIFATATTGSTGTTVQTLSNRVWVKGHTGFVGIGVANPSYTLDVSGSGDFSGGLTVTGSATINDILVITPRTTTPANPASGSIIVSGSGATIRPYFWDGSTWTQMFT